MSSSHTFADSIRQVIDWFERLAFFLGENEGTQHGDLPADLQRGLEALQEMDSSLTSLSRLSACFHRAIKAEEDHLFGQIKTLQGQIDDLYQHEQALKTDARELQAELQNVLVREQVTAQHIAAVRDKAATVAAQLRERMEKLEELKSYWWVPGYGQYLGIRTLVDDDIDTAQSLYNTLTDEQHQLDQYQTQLNHVRQTLSHTQALLQKDTSESAHWHDLRSQLNRRQQELGNVSVFFSNAGQFYKHLETLLTAGLDYSVETVQLIISLIEQEGWTPAFDAVENMELASLKSGLLKFAAAVDDGTFQKLPAAVAPVELLILGKRPAAGVPEGDFLFREVVRLGCDGSMSSYLRDPFPDGIRALGVRGDDVLGVMVDDFHSRRAGKPMHALRIYDTWRNPLESRAQKTRGFLVPLRIDGFVRMLALPDGRTVYLDAQKRLVHFVDAQGKYQEIIALEGASSDDMFAVVAGSALIVSEDGKRRLISVDLATHRVGVLRDLSPPSEQELYLQGKFPRPDPIVQAFGRSIPPLGPVAYRRETDTYYVAIKNTIVSFVTGEAYSYPLTRLPRKIGSLVVKGRRAFAASKDGRVWEVDLQDGRVLREHITPFAEIFEMVAV